MQPEHHSPQLDGMTCETTSCTTVLRKSRQKRGERFCLKCERRNLHASMAAQQQSAVAPAITPPTHTSTNQGVHPTPTPDSSQGVSTPIIPNTAAEVTTTADTAPTQAADDQQTQPGPHRPLRAPPITEPRVTRSKTNPTRSRRRYNVKRTTQQDINQYNFALAAHINSSTSEPDVDLFRQGDTIKRLRTHLEDDPLQYIYSLKWIGEHHGEDNPVDTIQRATATSSDNWADRVYYSFKQTQNPRNPYRHLMDAAKQKELDALLTPGHNNHRPPLVIVDRAIVPADAKIGRLLTLYSYKKDNNNAVVKGKLRIAYDGHADKLKPDLPDYYANISPTHNIRTIMALTPDDADDHQVYTADIPTAYLWADNNTEEYCELPRDLHQPDAQGRPAIARVVGALYGRIDSGHLFEKKRNEFLQNTCGLTQCSMDPSIFYNKATDIRVIAVVDDLFWRGSSKACNAFADHLKQEFGHCRTQPVRLEWIKYLGVLIRRIDDRIEWTSSRAIAEGLAKHDLHSLANKDLPAAPHTYTSKHDRVESDANDITHKTHTKTYMQRQGTLQWIATTGRYDITLAVKHAASVMSSPGPEHVQLHTRLFGYLHKTQNMVLTWNTQRSPVRPNQLYYHSDGSYLGEGLQSRMGFMGSINGGAVIANNATPTFQCTGIFDVEEAAACWAAKDIVYRREQTRTVDRTRIPPGSHHTILRQRGYRSIQLTHTDNNPEQARCRPWHVHKGPAKAQHHPASSDSRL